ncbi:MAG: hypothetical protein M5U07_02355 [Xanthobacteraceae bacterium]|nr:hypothetical protein [Xanthobacteraceae bacterium]
MLRRDPAESRIVDHLHVAVSLQFERMTVHQRLGRRDLAVRAIGRGQPGNGRVEVTGHLVHHGVGDDRPGELVHVKEQGEQAGEHQQAGKRDREVRDVPGTELLVDAAQDHQDVEDGAEEQADHGLDLPVADEVPDQSRAELSGRERQDHDGDRHDERRHGDHGRAGSTAGRGRSRRPR